MSVESFLEWLGSALVSIPSTLWAAFTEHVIRLCFPYMLRPFLRDGDEEPPPEVPRIRRPILHEGASLVGAQLRELRKSEKDVSSEMIASTLGCSRSVVLRIDRGEWAGIDGRLIDEYAMLFGTTVTQLLLNRAA
jgi:hypothetical protein